MSNRSCARCGGKIPVGKHIYSKYTKNYYCWDLDKCDKRAEKKKNEDILKMVTEMANDVTKEIEEHGFETF